MVPLAFFRSLCSFALMLRSAPWWKVDSLGTARTAKQATSSAVAPMTRAVSRPRPPASGGRSRRALARRRDLEENWKSPKAWVIQGLSRRAAALLWVWPLQSRTPPKARWKWQVRFAKHSQWKRVKITGQQVSWYSKSCFSNVLSALNHVPICFSSTFLFKKNVQHTVVFPVTRIKYVTVIALSFEINYDPHWFCSSSTYNTFWSALHVPLQFWLCLNLTVSTVYDKGEKKACHEICVIENMKSQLEGQSHVCVTQKPVSLCQRHNVCRNCIYLIPSKTFCD